MWCDICDIWYVWTMKWDMIVVKILHLGNNVLHLLLTATIPLNCYTGKFVFIHSKSIQKRYWGLMGGVRWHVEMKGEMTGIRSIVFSQERIVWGLRIISFCLFAYCPRAIWLRRVMVKYGVLYSITYYACCIWCIWCLIMFICKEMGNGCQINLLTNKFSRW